VTGDRDLAEKVAVTVEEFVYRSPLPPRWVEEIVAMRRKMETRSHIRAADFIDLKLGPGGMVDIEFILQLIQLHGRRPRPGSPGVLALLSQGDLSPLRTEESRELLHTYTWHRRLETQMRLTLDEGGSILP